VLNRVYRAHAGFVDPSISRNAQISNEALTIALNDLAGHDFLVDTDDDPEGSGDDEGPADEDVDN
jgi:hypothetical protein